VRDLVERARQGDRDAFAALVSESLDRLYAVARRILQDQYAAQDAVQSALLSAWRDLPSIRDVDRFEAWLHRLLVRACYEEARRARAFRASIRSIDSEPAMADSSGYLADREELQHAFQLLNVEQRAVVVLHFYLGLPLTDVADVLAVPEGTARSRLHYALRILRGAIDAAARPLPVEGHIA